MASPTLSAPSAVPKPTPSDHAADTAPGRGQWIAALYVFALAILLASFPARNSDVWRHVAAGRDLIESGDFAGIAGAFVHNSSVQQNWLYNLACYALYVSVGGAVLMAIKALLVAATGLIMLYLSRLGRDWWIPAACTTLALLAMSIRVRLMPATVSYLLLALSL